MDTPPNSPFRRHGAQPGNTNALKHGYYTRQFKKGDLTDLDQASQVSLLDEIAMLRIFTRRLLTLGHDAQTLQESLELVRVLSLATVALTRLIRTQYWLSSTKDEFSETIEQAILAVNQEFGLTDLPDEKENLTPRPSLVSLLDAKSSRP